MIRFFLLSVILLTFNCHSEHCALLCSGEIDLTVDQCLFVKYPIPERGDRLLKL